MIEDGSRKDLEEWAETAIDLIPEIVKDETTKPGILVMGN